MGMYTEIFFKGEIPKEQADIIEALRWGWPVFAEPNHEFFKQPRRSAIFSGTSAYFTGSNELSITNEYTTYVSGEPYREVSFRANLKNYDNEIEKFFDWIEPYVRDAGFYGYSQYEEAKAPTLYIKESK